MYDRGGSTVTMAVPRGPSARKAMIPPTITPGTVVCSHGVTGIRNVEVPMPGSDKAYGSPNEPRTGSSQTRTSGSLPVDTVVAQAVQADVGEVREAVVLVSDGNPGDQRAGGRIHHVHSLVVAPGCPQLRAVGVQLQHVGAASAWDVPFRDDGARGEIDHRERALEPVRDIERLGVARNLQPMCPAAGGDELDLFHRDRIDD